ncbi:hypothetical protein ES703_18821 [subsurface metagenome]
MMKKSRDLSRKRRSLTASGKRNSYPHIKLSRKKNQTKFIQEHLSYHFFLDLNGDIYYEKD